MDPFGTEKTFDLLQDYLQTLAEISIVSIFISHHLAQI